MKTSSNKKKIDKALRKIDRNARTGELVGSAGKSRHAATISEVRTGRYQKIKTGSNSSKKI